MTGKLFVCASAVGGLLAVPGPLEAQDARIVLRTPVEWEAGRSVAVEAGDTVRIDGRAIHGSGVLRVLVNDREATLTRDPQFPTTVPFAAALVAPPGQSRVVIRIVPPTGDAFSQEYVIEARPAEPPTGPQRPAVQAPPGQAPVRGNPWRGMMLRSVGYASIAGTGIYLGSKTTTDEVEMCQPTGAGQDCFRRITETASGRTLGLGLVAGAAVLTAIDLFVTSRRASRANPTDRRGDAGGEPGADLLRGGPRLVAPALDHRHGRVDALLINVRF